MPPALALGQAAEQPTIGFADPTPRHLQLSS
jgi:hypothetical protein